MFNHQFVFFFLFLSTIPGLNAIPPTLGKHNVASNPIANLSATMLYCFFQKEGFFIQTSIQTFLISSKTQSLWQNYVTCPCTFPYVNVSL